MPWVRAVLRGQTVYARADEAGALRDEGGLVEIRYKPSDGRLYRARAANLTVADGKVLPDDTCAPAEAVAKADAAAPAPGGAAQAPGRGAAGARGGRAGGRAAAGPGRVPEGAVIVYADGACSGNPGPAGLGVVILDREPRLEISEYLGDGTNNIAELTAILRALEEVDPAQPLAIHTDSQYSIGVLQKGWKAKANTALVGDLRELLAQRPSTRLVYVRGHAGVPLNERADALARQAVLTRKSWRTPGR